MPTGFASSSAPRRRPDSMLMRILLTLLFYAVLTPAAMLLRALRIDVIGRRFDERAGSYWHQRGSGDV
jgi:hypothetical protein